MGEDQRDLHTPFRPGRHVRLDRRRCGLALALGLLAAAAVPAQAVESGDDLVFAVDARAPGTGIGEAGLIAGEVDQKKTDVRAGLVKTTAEGTLVLEMQLGEPDQIVRKTRKTKVSQSRDLAMQVSVTDAGETIDETHAARVRKCALSVTFKDANGVNTAENLPDQAKWKLVCDKGWHQAFEALGDEARAVLKAVAGGGDFKLKGAGVAADRSDVLTDLDFVLIDPEL